MSYTRRTAALLAGSPLTNGMLALLGLASCLLLLSDVIPPIQSPDETEHLKRAYLLSRGQFLLSTPEGSSSGGEVDEGLMQFIDAFTTPLITSKQQVTPRLRAAVAKLRWTGTRHFETTPGTGYYFPVVYMPQTLAFLVGRALDLSIETSYYLARALCVLVSLLLLWAALRERPVSVATLALLLLPMSLFQLVSPTVDGMTNSLAVLCVSWWLQMMTTGQVQRWKVVALFVSVGILATSRIHLTALVVPLVALAVAQKRKDLWVGVAALGLGIVAWLALALHRTVDLRVVRGVTTVQAIQYYLTHPADGPRTIWATMSDANTHDFYGRSFVGVLGWLDTPLDPGVYSVAWLFLPLLLVLSFSWGEFRRELPARLILLSSTVIAALLVFVALMLTWSQVPTLLISGVQGRYFLVPALLVTAALGRTGRAPAVIEIASRLALGVWLLIGLQAMAVSLISRFHEHDFPAPVAPPIFDVRPSKKLTRDGPLPLHLSAAEAGNDDALRGIGLRIATHRNANPGQAQLRLVGPNGEVALRPFDLASLRDNEYAHFALEPADYVGGSVSSLGGEGISLWEAFDASGLASTCILYEYESGRTEVTVGCPPPTAAPSSP